MCSASPRERAVRLNGRSSAPSSPSRVTWVSTAAIGSASVITGRTSERASPLSETGSQPSRNENTVSSMIPSQNEGVDTTSSSTADDTRRGHRERPDVSTVTVAASTTATSEDQSASCAVGPIWSASSEETGCCNW